MGIRIRRTSSYLPNRIVDNFYFEGILDTSDDWISSRTGIKKRHFVEGEDMIDLLKRVVVDLNLSGKELKGIKTIIVATCTSSYAIPNLASQIQEIFDFEEDVYSLDINMGCTGFVAGLRLIEGIIKEGEYALLIGAEVFSKILDFTDRSTAVLFGDGAGAVLLEYWDKDNHFQFGTKGNSKALSYDCGFDKLSMAGREVYRFAVSTVGGSIPEFLRKNDIYEEDIDYFISHQANIRMLESMAKNLGVGMDRFPSNIDRVGNTSCASIPILLDNMNKEGRLKPGDKLLIFAFGAGLTWALTYMEW
ncbi:MAG: beta-ketoacyl-ACP synthase 3 [Tissierellia bacterium]|nr:beta-ketoacyl-ACP synthase 3 [Tissierellia bacterium]